MFCCSSSKTDSPRRPRHNEFTEIADTQHTNQPRLDESNNWRQQLMNREAGVTLALDLAISNMSNNEGANSAGIRKLKKLGQGGFGEVWLATTDEGQTKIAVKELNEPFIFVPGTEDIKDKLKQLPFFSEAAIQALLVHKNIVRTNGAHVNFVDPVTNRPIRTRDLMGGSMGRMDSSASHGSTEWTQIDNSMINELNLPSRVCINVRIVMEFCEHGSLFDYLRPHLPPELQHQQPHVVPLNIAIGGNMEQTLCAMMTALDVARGLRLLHRCRVVHGDLKPHNILLAKDEEDPRGFVAKLSDFGLSGHLAKGANAIGGVTHGSPAYMSPESLKDREVTTRSDIYALGVIMWELWHNEQWSSIYEPYRKMHGLKYTDMAEFKPKCHPTCPAEYSSIVERCLDADPMARPRPQDVSHLLENCIFERRAAMQI